MAIVTADIEYLDLGKVRGHFEADLLECDLEYFNSLSEEEQIEWIEDNGEILIDDFSVNDRGDLYNIEID